jgi:hypothetical protein
MSTRRERFRRGLHPLYLPFYDALCLELGDHWQPFYGLRSHEEQSTIYAQGRDRPGKIVTHARAGESPHNYGCASDWTIFRGGMPVWPMADDRIWNEYRDACEKWGLKWGGDFARFRDCFHNELSIRMSWKDLNLIRVSRGEDAANNAIRDSLLA